MADDDGALVILETRAEDFARRGAESIHEDRHREVRIGSESFGVPASRAAVASVGTDDHAFFDEHIGDFDGRLQQSSGVEPEVENEGLHAVIAKGAERIPHFIGAAAGEMSQPDVADLLILIEHEVPGSVRVASVTQHGVELDDVSGKRDRLDLFNIGMLDADGDLFAGRAFQHFDRLLQFPPFGETFDRFTFDLDDAIPGADPGGVGRAAGQGSDNFDIAVLGIPMHLNANASEFLIDDLLEFGQVVGLM